MQTLRTPRLKLIPFEPAAISRLIEGDRAAAEAALGAVLPQEFPTAGDLAGFLPIQLHRMQESPDRRDWMARLMTSHKHEIIGHCGFHGPPEVIGRAEIGYTVFTPYRGQGFAKEAARALVGWGVCPRRVRGLRLGGARQSVLAGRRAQPRLHAGRDAG